MLTGEHGEGKQIAMRMIARLAEMQGASRLIDASWAHVASAYDQTRVNRDFAERLAASGTRVAISTTLTACSTDPLKNPDPQALALIELYKGMGCDAAMTCAPYFSRPAPKAGEVLAWCESSAIAYANSVLGAYCNRYPEFLDMCAAVTGRVPEAGLYIEANRRARALFRVAGLARELRSDDRYVQLLGLYIGLHSGHSIPAIDGLPKDTSNEQLRMFAAAAAAAGSLNMFHAVGLTPEAATTKEACQGLEPDEVIDVSFKDLARINRNLDRGPDKPLTAVCIGAPHADYDTLAGVAHMLDGHKVHEDVSLHLSTSGEVCEHLADSGQLAMLDAAGANVVTGRCTYYPPALSGCDGHVMTNSAKWAWYARSMLPCGVRFANLENCVKSAVAGWDVS